VASDQKRKRTNIGKTKREHHETANGIQEENVKQLDIQVKVGNETITAIVERTLTMSMKSGAKRKDSQLRK
jgi:hypothetical protein